MPPEPTPDCLTRLAEAEARYRSLFENAFCGIYQTRPGADGLLDANPALAALLGYPSAAALLATLTDLDAVYVLPGRRAELRRRLETEGTVTGLESEIRRPDGTRLWISENARAVRDADGRLLRHEGTIEDIGERRQAAEALRHARDELEDRVRERTAELALFNGTLLQQTAERERAEDNARRVELEHEDRVRQQTAVAELGRFALQGPDLPAILEKTSEVIARALELPYGVVTELLPDGKNLRVLAVYGWPKNVVGRTFANWRSLTPEGQLFNSEPLVVDDLRQDSRYAALPEVPGCDRPVGVVSVVVHSGGRPFGTLIALSSSPREFGPRDVTFLQTVADLLSTLIEGKRQEAVSREAEARYQRIVANIPGVVYQYVRHADGTRSLPFVSEGCRQVYELDAATLRAHPLLLVNLIDPEDRAGYDAAEELSARTLDPFKWEGRIRVPSGEIRWIVARSRPELQANGDIVWDGLVLDVSELKRAQETMRLAKEEAEKANHAKSEFLSRVSHELRTPLNVILGFGQLLSLDPLEPTQASSVDQILRSGRRLLDLINEVLEIAHIDSGGLDMTLERVEAGAALAEAALFTRPLADQRRVGFVSGGAPADAALAVMADRGRLKQVLLNLFSNAVKFNREGDEVRYACARRPDGRTVRLSVTDTGPGLSRDEVARLFTPFERLGAAGRGIAGKGIGLTTAKSLVEAMGGTVGVDSTPGRGSTFFVDLPAPADALLPAPADAGSPAPRVAPAPRTVLHIHDQEGNLILIEHLLGPRPDLRLISAADGRHGLELANEQRPALILLDLHLPDLPGEEVVRRLRDGERTRDIPVVVLSADAAAAQVSRLGQLGVADYLVKPFKVQAFLQVINTLLHPLPVG